MPRILHSDMPAWYLLSADQGGLAFWIHQDAMDHVEVLLTDWEKRLEGSLEDQCGQLRLFRIGTVYEGMLLELHTDLRANWGVNGCMSPVTQEGAWWILPAPWPTTNGTSLPLSLTCAILFDILAVWEGTTACQTPQMIVIDQCEFGISSDHYAAAFSGHSSRAFADWVRRYFRELEARGQLGRADGIPVADFPEARTLMSQVACHLSSEVTARPDRMQAFTESTGRFVLNTLLYAFSGSFEVDGTNGIDEQEGLDLQPHNIADRLIQLSLLGRTRNAMVGSSRGRPAWE